MLPEEEDFNYWQWLDIENDGREENGWEPSRPGERYFDAYWGWWNSLGAQNGSDCPIIYCCGDGNEYDDWDTMDGAHRVFIARLAHIRTIPAIVGILKEEYL